jgi:L-2-hydroxyglutarate oxidase LhgO
MIVRVTKRVMNPLISALQWLEREDALKMEPKLRCHSAVFSPSTGIVDSQG